MRIGLVGTGHWARATHAPAIARHQVHELVGVWGRSEHRRNEFASEFGIQTFGSFDQMATAVDAIAFATDPDQQTDLAPRAVEAGRHLILDKPAALTSQEVRQLEERSVQRGLTTKVFHTARYRPEIELWIEKTARGAWQSGEGRWLGTALSDSSGPYFESAWRKERGPLWDLGPHAMSILLPIFGPVTSIPEVGWEAKTLKAQLHFESAEVRVQLSLAAPQEVSGIDLTISGPDGRTVMPAISTTHQEAYGLLLDRFTDDGDTSDLRLGSEVVSALELVESAMDRE
ncbi:Gfo/Idh/MocA family protein [Subtercola lobariae]|uniref:Oxidoreductase n=1 Tax=Subtercola lobariae TaxID=1588641 RepID=A0A917EVJ8_9MICO|nr:Gfo/Idh/MocA family oxidoreductase [Subtercola lobariae]GGF18402.1 oxidoreductase [Subtercola lobariae]